MGFWGLVLGVKPGEGLEGSATEDWWGLGAFDVDTPLLEPFGF